MNNKIKTIKQLTHNTLDSHNNNNNNHKYLSQ